MLQTREDLEVALWNLFGATVKATAERIESEDCKPADISNAIKLLQNNTMTLTTPKELQANPQVILDELKKLPFTDAELDEDDE